MEPRVTGSVAGEEDAATTGVSGAGARQLLAKNSFGRYVCGSRRPMVLKRPDCAPGATVTVLEPDTTVAFESG